MKLTIIANYDFPPVPDRNMDWSAVTDNYDYAPDAPMSPIGRGRTKWDAIRNLIERLEMDDE